MEFEQDEQPGNLPDRQAVLQSAFDSLMTILQ